MRVWAVWCEQCEEPMLGAWADEYVAKHIMQNHEYEHKHDCRVMEMKLTYSDEQVAA